MSHAYSIFNIHEPKTKKKILKKENISLKLSQKWRVAWESASLACVSPLLSFSTSN